MPDVTVSMPLQLTREMMTAVRTNELTALPADEWHARLGWLICAYDVLLEFRCNTAPDWRDFLIPVTLPDGRIAKMRRCDLRDDDLVTFIDGSNLAPHTPGAIDAAIAKDAG